MSLDERLRQGLARAAPVASPVELALVRVRHAGRRRMRVRRVAAVVAGGALGVAAIAVSSQIGSGGQSGGIVAPAPSRSVSPEATPTVRTTPSKSTVSVPRPAPAGKAGPCRSARDRDIPSSARCISQVGADLDADGRVDRFIIYADADSKPSAVAFHARSVLATGKRSDAPVENILQECCEPSVLGAADADGDGRAEVFVIVDHGASAAWAGVFHLIGDGLQRVEVKGRRGPNSPASDEGRPTTFTLSGGVNHGGGLECRKRGSRYELVALGGSDFDQSGNWEWTEDMYRWSRGHLEYVRTSSGVIRGVWGSAEHERRLARFYELRCGGLKVGA